MQVFQAHHGRLLVAAAHDATIMRQARALAARSERMVLMVARTGPAEELFRFYGVPEGERVQLVQLPALRREQWPRVSLSAVFELACLRELRRRLKDEPDGGVLYLRELKLARFFLRFRWWLGLPIVFEFHNFRFPDPGRTVEAYDRVEASVLRRVDALITTTRALAEAARRIYGLEREPIPIPLAAELDVEPAPLEVTGWKQRDITLCYLGQLYRLQGVEVAIEALAELPRCRLLVVGGKPEDIDRLRGHAGRLGCADRVRFSGYVAPAEVRRRLAEADVFLLPALAEGRMPYAGHTKLYEYLASRRPIVTSDLASVREEVTDGETALLVAPGSPQTLAAGVRRMLDSPELAYRLAEAGYRLAQRYSYDVRAGRLLEVFREVAGGRVES